MIVSLGAVAGTEFGRRLSVETAGKVLVGPVGMAGAERFIVFLPHPNAFSQVILKPANQR